MTSRVMINGRWVEVPRSTSDEEIRQVAGVDPHRMLIRRTREGNYVVTKGSHVLVDDGDAFIDAPARVKG